MGDCEGLAAWCLPRLPGIEASRPRHLLGRATPARRRGFDAESVIAVSVLPSLPLFSLACPAVFWSDVLWKKGSFFSLALAVDCHEFAMDVF